MKKLIVVLPSLLVLCITIFLFNRVDKAQERIAVLDYKKIISESSAVKIAGDYFSLLQEEYKVAIEAIQNKTEQATILEAKQAEFTARIEAVDVYLNTALENLITSYRTKNNISLVIPKETVLSLDNNIDITEAIIKEFNTISLTVPQIQKIIEKAAKEKSAMITPNLVPEIEVEVEEVPVETTTETTPKTTTKPATKPAS